MKKHVIYSKKQRKASRLYNRMKREGAFERKEPMGLKEKQLSAISKASFGNLFSAIFGRR